MTRSFLAAPLSAAAASTRPLRPVAPERQSGGAAGSSAAATRRGVRRPALTMASGPHHLAQANVARFRAPLDDPVMREFVARIVETNALTERSRGFVWRHAGGRPDELDVFRHYAEPFDRARFFFNMSVWESVEALRAYVFDSAHASLLGARARWMAPFARPTLALWWIPAGRPAP